MTAIGNNFSMVDLENRVNEHNDLVKSRDRSLNLQEKRDSKQRLVSRRKLAGRTLNGIYTVDEYSDALQERRSLLKH